MQENTYNLVSFTCHTETAVEPSQHCDTRSMLADPLTKPMTPGLSTPHIRKMIGLDNIENKTCTPNKDEEEVFDALTAYFLNFSLEDDFEDEV